MKKLLSAVTALLLGVGMLVLPSGAAQAATKATSTVTVWNTASKTVKANSSTSVAFRVKTGGSYVKRNIVVQRRAPGQGWKSVTRYKTTSAGSTGVKLKVGASSGSYKFRIIVKTGQGGKSTTSDARVLKVKAKTPGGGGGGTDSRYGTCAAAKAAGLGPYYRGIDPEYNWYRDADSDGIVCE